MVFYSMEPYKRRVNKSSTKAFIICYIFCFVFLDVVQVSQVDTLRGEKMNGRLEIPNMHSVSQRKRPRF